MSPVPPRGVQRAAARAVRWIEEGRAGKGFTATGRHRAHQLADGEDVDDDTIGRMHAYFSRDRVDKDATGFRRGEDGYPSPGRVAWDAWGGDPGQGWASRRASRTNG